MTQRSSKKHKCPKCKRKFAVKNGHSRNEQTYLCRNCGYQFYEHQKEKKQRFKTKQISPVLENKITDMTRGIGLPIEFQIMYGSLEKKDLESANRNIFICFPDTDRWWIKKLSFSELNKIFKN